MATNPFVAHVVGAVVHHPGPSGTPLPQAGSLEYEGETVFRLTPGADLTGPELESIVENVLADGPYRSGDFLELPLALWLVRDDETADVFRVSIRDGSVRLHVLPSTESAGLRRFYDRLTERGDCDWHVQCRTDLA